jgi:hypothetical protein
MVMAYPRSRSLAGYVREMVIAAPVGHQGTPRGGAGMPRCVPGDRTRRQQLTPLCPSSNTGAKTWLASATIH